ncbi:hypothetical protein IJ182_10275 [bacterium]|nr:hypothetical protein [bacterium]
MDDKKIINLNIDKTKKEEPAQKQASSFSFHTNPILKKMLVDNLNNKKGKFSLKDWFK